MSNKSTLNFQPEIDVRITYYTNLKFKSVIRPVITYGAETCVLQEDCCKLRVFERKTVRKVYGTTQVDGQWTLRSNAEIEGLFKKKKNIENFMRGHGLR